MRTIATRTGLLLIAIISFHLAGAQKPLIHPKESHLRSLKRLTDGTNADAYFSADGKKLIFQSTSDPYTQGIPNVDLYIIDRDGSGLQQITFDKGFDAFPMFSNDGEKLVWASSRNGSQASDINIFIADWVN